MILSASFKAMRQLRDSRGLKIPNDGKWAPPPVLQACYELRTQGLSLFLRIGGVYRIRDFNAKDIVNHKTWLDDVYAMYSFRHSPPPSSLWIFHQVDAGEALTNLWTWLKFFYEQHSGGVLLEGDETQLTIGQYCTYPTKQKPAKLISWVPTLSCYCMRKLTSARGDWRRYSQLRIDLIVDRCHGRKRSSFSSPWWQWCWVRRYSSANEACTIEGNTPIFQNFEYYMQEMWLNQYSDLSTASS